MREFHASAYVLDEKYNYALFNSHVGWYGMEWLENQQMLQRYFWASKTQSLTLCSYH